MAGNLIFTPIMTKFTYPDTGKLTPEAIAFFRQLFLKLDGVTPFSASAVTGDVTFTGLVSNITAGVIVNADINASAAIAYTKLAALTVNRALVSGAGGFIEVSAVTSTELGYVSGVTSAIQTQLNNKQPLDATLTGLAALSGTGFVVETAADVFTNRSITAGAGISIADGDGIAANPVITSTITQYTDEMAQDAVGSILVDSATVDFTYNDALNTITASIITTGDWTGTFDGQEGSYYLSRTNHTGTQLSTTISDFTEAAQDAVGNILTDSSTIDFTYTDGSNIITAAVNPLGLTFTYPLMNYGGYKFDGSTHYLDGNPLGTASVDQIIASKVGNFYLRLRFANAASAPEILQATNNNYIRIDRQADGDIQITGKNAAGTTIINIVTTNQPCSAAGEYAIMISYDLTTAGTARINITKISDGTYTNTVTETTYTNDTIAYATPTEYSIGASNAGVSFFNGDMYIFWFDPTAWMEYNTESNRRKFLAPDLKQVFLGWQGELPTGYQPVLFLGYDSYTNWFRNRGSAVSTNFVEHGTPAAVTTALSGQYSAGRNGNKTRTVTAAGAVYVGIADDTVGINKTVGAATTVNLPKATGSGKRYRIVDVKGDANTNNITLTPPSGTINGAATFVMNVNYQAETIEDMATDVYMRT